MIRTAHAIILVVSLILAALALAQDSLQIAEAPYVTDAGQAQAEAAEKGKDALIYFYSDT